MADLNRDGIDDGPVVERTTVVNTGGGGGSSGLIAVIVLLAVLAIGYLLYSNGTFGGSKTEIKVPDSINVNVN
ncbi:MULTISPECIES: hypothetical protein [Sphingomonas]|uniref:Uncharacterized protein n=2 Tax=Sphingomonas TaxID=13687 RepID=A0A7X5Y5D0_9SPHN|nr:MULTISPECIES: hypothetical protein [Sphingomonas]NJC05043.1 hypothetical protein [Sphingomonas kaistensis]UUR07469.1 hypothetical protein M1K48_11045 [Sphingomonas glaciei]